MNLFHSPCVWLLTFDIFLTTWHLFDNLTSFLTHEQWGTWVMGHLGNGAHLFDTFKLKPPQPITELFFMALSWWYVVTLSCNFDHTGDYTFQTWQLHITVVFRGDIHLSQRKMRTSLSYVLNLALFENKFYDGLATYHTIYVFLGGLSLHLNHLIP